MEPDLVVVNSLVTSSVLMWSPTTAVQVAAGLAAYALLGGSAGLGMWVNKPYNPFCNPSYPNGYSQPIESPRSHIVTLVILAVHLVTKFLRLSKHGLKG